MREPAVCTAPKLVSVAEEAFVVPHVRVELPPEVMEVGFAVMVHVGGFEVTVTVA
jgi:hypothetical protein